MGDITSKGSLWTVPVNGKVITVEVLSEFSANPRILLVRTARKVVRVCVEKREDPDAFNVELNGRPLVARLEEETLLAQTRGSETVEGSVLISSPMAGKVASVKALVGAIVEEGQALVVLEAMKMENEIAAPRKGTVKEVYVQRGSLAKAGDRLVLIE